MDAHELISALKALALELDRVPTREEFCSRVRGSKQWLENNGGFITLIHSAGFTYQRNRNQKPKAITNEVFVKNIDNHLEEYVPQPELPMPKPFAFGTYPKIMSISDMHLPFWNKRLIDAFLKRGEEVQPEYLFFNGDAWDMYSHSKFPRSHNVFTPREEERLAREQHAWFWTEIKKRAPKAICVQLMGNHDIRPMRRALEKYPEIEHWVEEKLASLFTFEDVKTIYDPREEYLLGDIAIFHGYRTQLGAHRDYTFYNTMNGHSHSGGAVFRKIRNKILWEVNSGLSGDPQSKGLTYTPQRITHWTPGWSEVDRFGPRFVPFF